MKIQSNSQTSLLPLKCVEQHIKKGIITAVLFLFIIMPTKSYGNSNVKEPNVSGQFYNSDPKVLSADLDRFFSDAKIDEYRKDVKIIISPHAGYVYSGHVAAYGYKAASKNQYKTIILLAPSHYFGFRGFSVGDFDSFKTPLGLVEVDKPFVEQLIGQRKNILFEPQAFEKEHSIEVQIPFLQKTFHDFKIVPVIIGRPGIDDLKEFSSLLAKIIGERGDVLIVVSTDMSHFHDDQFARKMDGRTIEAVKNFQADTIYKECGLGTMELCGVFPVVTALYYAQEKGYKGIEVLKYANSSEVSGDVDRVVGYFSAIIYKEGEKAQEVKPRVKKGSKVIENNGDLSLDQKRRLIEIAKETITTYIKTGKKLDIQEADERLNRVEGAFVTIHEKGMLRGCIGNIIGRGPLYLTVRNMAISAATQDPRFPPLTKEELDQIEIEISVLSKPKVTTNPDEIIMGKHGVIVSRGPFNQGVFLPQVADSTGWDRDTFLSELCAQKAGLPPNAWKDPKTKLETFTAIVFSEADVK